MSNYSKDDSPAISGQLQHRAFNLVVILKGLNGVLELAGGLALLLVSSASILSWVDFLTQSELSQDPRDLVANSLVHWVINFGHDSQIFVAGYLLFHGVAKVTLAVLLMRGMAWVYPLAIAFFSIFVAYAGYRLSLGWSLPLVGAIMVDVLTIIIVVREWRLQRLAG